MKHWERICIRDRAGPQKRLGVGGGGRGWDQKHLWKRRFGITQGENALLFQTEENKIGYKIL